MKPRARRARAVLRDRRRGTDGGPPIVGPLTGYDLFLSQWFAARTIVEETFTDYRTAALAHGVFADPPIMPPAAR